MKKYYSTKTVLLLAILVILTISLIGSIAAYTTVQNSQLLTLFSRAATCAQVVSVSYSPSPLGSGTDFRCTVNITPESVAESEYSMTCGWRKNGGWPDNGGRWNNPTCNGTVCTFDIRMDPNLDPNASYTLAGYDFRGECGPDAGGAMSVPINISVQQPTSTPVPQNTPVPTSPQNTPTPYQVRCSDQEGICLTRTSCTSNTYVNNTDCSANLVCCLLDPTNTPVPTVRATATPRPSATPTTPPEAQCGYYGQPCCSNGFVSCLQSDLRCDTYGFCVNSPTSTPTPIPTSTPTPTPQPGGYYPVNPTNAARFTPPPLPTRGGQYPITPSPGQYPIIPLPGRPAPGIPALQLATCSDIQVLGFYGDSLGRAYVVFQFRQIPGIYTVPVNPFTKQFVLPVTVVTRPGTACVLN